MAFQKLLQQYEKQQLILENQLKEYQQKCYYEQKCWQLDRLVAGVDEVGRGCLAGPVVCAAVILNPQVPIIGVDDSKKLRPESRTRLAKIIKEESLAYSVALISPSTIDQINILEASRLAMKFAVQKLSLTPESLLVDAVKIETEIPQTDLIKGDEKSASIGAASILAKVCRDELMDRYDEFYPEYNFKSNKGYGTREHLLALKEFGISPIHRKSFSPVRQIIA